LPKIIAIGEALIDFIPITSGKGLADTPSFEKRPGGAPANVAVGVARLGGSSGFLGKFGQDGFGDFLLRTLQDNGVNIKEVVKTSDAKTGLAFVTLKDNGEREFIFYRQPCADILLNEDEIPEDYIKEADILHFGTVSLIVEPGRTATYRAVNIAKKAGKIISLDVNLREALWPSLDLAHEEIMSALKQADIVKVSEEELSFILGSKGNIDEGAGEILALGPGLVFVTLGDKGCYVKTKHFGLETKGIKVAAVDATGAGDAFTAAILTRIVETGVHRPTEIGKISQEQMKEICIFANIAGALTCTKKGAISALPTRAEVEDIIRQEIKAL